MNLEETVLLDQVIHLVASGRSTALHQEDQLGGSSGSIVTMILLTTYIQDTAVLLLFGPTTVLDQMILMSGKTGRMVTMEVGADLGISVEEPLVDLSLMFTKHREKLQNN